MKRLMILLSLLTVSAAFAQINVMPGMKMPEIRADWINAPQEKTPPQGAKIIEVVVFTDVTTPDVVQTIRYAESLNGMFRRRKGPDQIRFRVVTVNEKSAVETFLKQHNEPVSIVLGGDKEGRTFRNFVVAKVPSVVIGENGRIAWLGPVTEIEPVVKALLAGNFSAETYQAVSRLRTEAQTALRAGLPEVAGKTARKILETLPSDTIALQTILYSYEVKNQFMQAVEFLRKSLEEHPEDPAGRVLLLMNEIRRSGDFGTWEKDSLFAISLLKEVDAKLNFAAFLVEASPMEFFPVDAVFPLCESVLADPVTLSDPEFHANALEIAAKAEYAVCRIDNAVTYQEQAEKLRISGKSPYLERTRSMLQRYRMIRSLQKK